MRAQLLSISGKRVLLLRVLITGHMPPTPLLPQHSSLPLPLRSSELRLPLFPSSSRFSKMEPRSPSLHRSITDSTSNHYHEHDSRRNSDDPEIDV